MTPLMVVLSAALDCSILERRRALLANSSSEASMLRLDVEVGELGLGYLCLRP